MAQIGLDNTTVVIGGHTVTGWSDDSDALTMPDEYSPYNIRYGADGELAAFRTGRKGGEVTIKVLPTSPTARYFIQQMENIRRNPGAEVNFNGTVRNTGAVPFTVHLRDGVLMTAPMGYTMGAGDVANRMFTFAFEEIQVDA